MNSSSQIISVEQIEKISKTCAVARNSLKLVRLLKDHPPEKCKKKNAVNGSFLSGHNDKNGWLQRWNCSSFIEIAHMVSVWLVWKLWANLVSWFDYCICAFWNSFNGGNMPGKRFIQNVSEITIYRSFILACVSMKRGR